MSDIVIIYNAKCGRSTVQNVELSAVFPIEEFFDARATNWCVISGSKNKFGNWHTVSSPLLSIVVSGEWEVQTELEAGVKLKTGDLLFATDTSGKGHRSRVLSDIPCTVVGIGLEQLTESIAALLQL